MKDGLERRALLLHLGEVMETVASAFKRGGERDTVRHLSAADASLASLRLLEQVSPHMTVAEFAQRTSAAFCTWPSALLEAELDHEALALPVERHLFAGNPDGWRAYIAQRQVDVPWFGEGVPVPEAVTEPVSWQAPGAPEDKEPDAADIERAREQDANPRESVESSRSFYPSWPWRPDV